MKQLSRPANRRCEPRVPASHLVSCTPHRRYRSGNPVYTARTLDLSESGLRLESDHAFPPGEELDIEMALAGQIVHLTGLAVHAECLPEGRFAAGIQLTRVVAGERARLHEAVNRGRS